jgi:hypothetical protein
MSKKVNAEIVFIFKDELKRAARSIREVMEASKKSEEELSNDDFMEIMIIAMEMCNRALHSVEDSLDILLCHDSLEFLSLANKE